MAGLRHNFSFDAVLSYKMHLEMYLNGLDFAFKIEERVGKFELW